MELVDEVAVYIPERYAVERVPHAEALGRSDAHLAAMSTRRSVRRFSSDPVPLELIENALRVAGSAPSGANQQPWTFVVVTDDETKRRIRDGAEHEERLLYEQRASAEYLDAIRPIGTDAVKPHLTEPPCLIAVFEQPWRLDADGEKRKHYYVRESVGIAVGFLLTALHLSGLATLTHAPSPMGFLTEILDRPENERPFLEIPVGYPAADAEVPSLEKKQLDEIAVFV
jgi:nitroreductase